MHDPRQLSPRPSMLMKSGKSSTFGSAAFSTATVVKKEIAKLTKKYYFANLTACTDFQRQ
jgi:hypothetical protein